MNREEAAAEIERLSEILRACQHDYYILGRPSKPDAEYDGLFDSLLALERRFPGLVQPDSPTSRVGSDLSSDLPETPHTIPVLSLDKAYTIQGILDWMKKTAANFKGGLSFTAEEKIDGVSIVLYYEEGLLVRGVTRGNGYVGNDVTANIKTIKTIPLRLSKPVNVTVRGEIYMEEKDFFSVNESMEVPYANPRNFAAGVLRRIKSREVASIPLTIFVYDAYFGETLTANVEALGKLESLGFRLNRRRGFFSQAGPPDEAPAGLESWTCGGLDDVAAFIEKEEQDRKNLPYAIDGLVIKVNELEAREALGFTGHHPRWALAYKFEAPGGVTTVKAIDVQVGRTGRATPVARVEPVEIGGSTVSNATLHNQDYIDLLELAVGDTVAVSKRGDIIPAVERV
ncbi:MAG: NAD-dependent DNA ligase LigA, partial [Spirochaetales bacterium]